MIKLTVNGQLRDVMAPDDTPLLDVLRSELNLKGSRFGCGLAQCGACMVLLDGYPVPSCDTPLWSATGKQVVTVEGLGSSTRPHRLQASFIKHQAGQCGYCLSGILIRAAALLHKNPKPSEADIRQALDGNLCRCGAHNRMVRAILDVSEQ